MCQCGIDQLQISSRYTIKICQKLIIACGKRVEMTYGFSALRRTMMFVPIETKCIHFLSIPSNLSGLEQLVVEHAVLFSS